MPATDTKRITSPFPISKMTHDHHETLILPGQLVKNSLGFRFEPAMIHHVFPRDGQRFESFQKKITEITVKAFFYFPDFLICLIRK